MGANLNERQDMSTEISHVFHYETSKEISMKWTPLSDELPPFGKPVLVYHPGYKGQPVTVAKFICIDAEGHRFNFDIDSAVDRGNTRCSVTHWMPYPEPPEGDQA